MERLLMFPALKKISLTGEPYDPAQHADQGYLQELSAGDFLFLQNSLSAVPNAKERNISATEYKVLILSLCLWNNNTPYIREMVEEYCAVSETPVPTAIDSWKVPSDFLKNLKPVFYLDTCYYFATKVPKAWVDATYQIADENLQPTSEATKQVLGND